MIWRPIVHQIHPEARNNPDLPRVALGLATARRPADAVLVIRTPPESGHTIYDTFDDEKRVI